MKQKKPEMAMQAVEEALKLTPSAKDALDLQRVFFKLKGPVF